MASQPNHSERGRDRMTSYPVIPKRATSRRNKADKSGKEQSSKKTVQEGLQQLFLMMKNVNQLNPEKNIQGDEWSEDEYESEEEAERSVIKVVISTKAGGGGGGSREEGSTGRGVGKRSGPAGLPTIGRMVTSGRKRWRVDGRMGTVY